MKKIIFTLIFTVLFSYIFADLNFGKKLFEDGLFGEAIVEFEKTITAAPTSENAQNAMFLIGKSYRKKDDYLMAEATFKRLLDGYSNLPFREEAIYNLAMMQFEQKKNETAILNFEILLEKYPSNDFTKKSLTLYLESIYNTKNYNRVVVKARKLIKNYEIYPNIPFVYLWLAKAYFANQMLTEGEQVLAEITTKYSDHTVHWAAVDLEVELIQKRDGMQNSTSYLEEKLDGKIPRNYEEKLRLKLAKTYYFSDNFHQSYKHLKIIVEKFGNSENLPEYIILLVETQLALSKYVEIENDYPNFKKVFKGNLLKLDYEYYLAEAKYSRRKHGESAEILQKISNKTSSPTLQNKTRFLEAKIKAAKGKYKLAIEMLQKLTNVESAIKNDVLQFIGEIYFTKFNDFQTALKYFQKIELSAKNHQIAIFKSAECYEKLGEIEQAIFELSRLNLTEFDNQLFRNKVANKLEYLQNYEQKNFEKAFNSLLNAIYDYSQTDDKIVLRNNIFSIYANDLKEFEKGLNLVQNDGTPQIIYQKTLVYLQLAKKSFLNDNPAKMQEFIQLADNLAAQLSEQKFPHWIAEIAIKKQLIQSQKTDETLIVKLENFVENFENSSIVNDFRLLVSRHYMGNNNFEKAAKHIDNLENSDTIDEKEFCEMKLQLAEYFYGQNDDLRALNNFEMGEKFLTINQPEIYFHFGVTLHETGSSQKAAGIFEFILQNADRFAKYDDIIAYYTKILRTKKEFRKALNYMQYLEINSRDDEYYRQISNDYLQIGGQEKAKEFLMHIIEKTDDDLLKLADLQFATQDYEMAKYSFGKLAEKTGDLQHFEMLGEIAFLQEDFLEAAINYKKIIDKLGDDFANHKNIRKISKENIIALYRIENRPKAETLQKKFKNTLTENDENEIELHRGIYYIEMDKKKAKSIFTKLLKKQNLSQNVAITAYFWRGVAFLKSNEKEEAKNDFTIVSRSVDKDLSNQAHLKLGTINFSDENFKEALAHYSEVIQNDEDGKLAFDATRNFAFVCKTMKEWQKAIAAYQLILERWGDEDLEAKTLFDIAFCYYRDKKFSKAIEMFERTISILEKEEERAEAQYWIGHSYFEMENYEKAISELLKVKYNYGDIAQWSATAELLIGEAYTKNGKISKAKEAYQKIIRKYGKFSQWGEVAQTRLQNFN